MDFQGPTPVNVKCHFKIATDYQPGVLTNLPNCLFCELSCRCSCRVFRWRTCSVFIYVSTGTVNITGLKSFNDIDAVALEFMEEFLDEAIRSNLTAEELLSSTLTKAPSVDNSTALFKAPFAINLQRLRDELKALPSSHHLLRRVYLNPQRFPSLKVTLVCGTANIFSTGSIVLLGVKNIEDLNKITEFLKSRLQSHQQHVG